MAIFGMLGCLITVFLNAIVPCLALRSLWRGTTKVRWTVVLLMSFMLAHVGVSIGYHRYFSHRSFSVSAPGKWFLATLGTLTLQGSPMYWAAQHRLHHRYCEVEGDPHSPKGGFFGFLHAHGGFLTGLTGDTIDQHPEFSMRVVSDLASDPDLAILASWPLGAVYPALVMFGTPLVGYCLFGFGPMLWHLHMPQFLAWHATLTVNSATHTFGYARRPLPGGEDIDVNVYGGVSIGARAACHARNVPWLWPALLGEAWHANHHADPGLVSMEGAWWEVDPQSILLVLLARCRLVWDLRLPPPRRALAGPEGGGKAVAQMLAPPLLIAWAVRQCIAWQERRAGRCAGGSGRGAKKEE
mmetsp:Transcript_97363/g.247617  ORF Transcript_97363/g.247617 Transcript_97363/m.247617 type:complete len:355 (+) Transcript_97363:91-1155(+)